MTTVRQLITVGAHTVALTPDEARITAEGEVPRGLAARLEALGIVLPPRGTIHYYREIHFDDRIVRTEAHMRRLPEWDRKKVA